MPKIKPTLSRIELLQLRDDSIRKDFTHFTKVKLKDAEHVVNDILQYKYFLDVGTLWRIVTAKYRKAYNTEKTEKKA